jgi:hypothetical protein
MPLILLMLASSVASVIAILFVIRRARPDRRLTGLCNGLCKA